MAKRKKAPTRKPVSRKPKAARASVRKPTPNVQLPKTQVKAMSKGEFVKALPVDMRVRDVLAEAKRHGMKLSRNYIYLVRAGKRADSAGSSKRGGAAKAKRPAAAKKKAARPAAKKAAAPKRPAKKKAKR